MRHSGAIGALLALWLTGGAAWAETLVAARNLRPQTVLTPLDISLRDIEVPGALGSAEGVLGMETRVTIYAGRPILPGDLGPPALVERNGIVGLIYDRAGLVITAEGRALGRGGVGETIRVMNLSSRQTISGTIQPDGTVRIP
ncbi:flagellar basal body P-ring formation chaperone FlgA [Pseudooceanicola sp. 200-1SW]|uniref:flagellar basal body P-ring formation chaperone FlgA n=1 Tax=Pseudooceanicola sp. 200-1SW TaxID=3425949 RepID=UPI003D7FC457